MIKDWIEQHRLNATFIVDFLFEIEGVGRFFVLSDKERVFGEMFNLIVDHREFTEANNCNADFYVYRFGGQFFYTPITAVNEPQMNPLRHIGTTRDALSTVAYLGVHGSYELMNGTRDYKSWCRKAKFLGYGQLGLCERNTLAGTLAFQMACEKANIKPILGESVAVDYGTNKLHDIKLYVKNYAGWKNLLNINKIVNIDNDGTHIALKDLLTRGEGLVLVVTPETPLSSTLIHALKSKFDEVFYQFNPYQFTANQRDQMWLEAHKSYLQHHYSELEPIILSEAYYLDEDEATIKHTLNKMSNFSPYKSNKEYFKGLQQIFEEIEPLFHEDDIRCYDIFEQGTLNLEKVANDCNFQIELGKLHLPKYEMNPDEAEQFQSNDDLFWHIIESRLETLQPAPGHTIEEYYERVSVEADVITRGGFQDYFLILWDINNWCRKNRILTGIGRGSAGGSLIAYLCGITKIDPIRYDLLFERFLNESRIKSSLPDIDTDFEGKRREEVKQYMIDKYGHSYVCSVGTYTTFGMKGAIKDLARQYGVDFATTNYITAILDLEDESWRELFINATTKPKVKEFILQNPELVSMIPLCLKQPKTASIHACATLIVPKTDHLGNPMTIYDWLPVRKTDDGQLISEWEGSFTEAAGFLKEDILGIKQLDKFRKIFDLIEETTGVEVRLEDIPLDDPNVYKLFQEGNSEDVFHLGTEGLIGYGKDVKPDCIEDLIAMIALHRPGTMNSGSHIRYVHRKFRKEEPEYDYGLREVTQDTYGLYIYQEQVMKAVQVLGGLSLVDADGVRKAMGKKIKEKMDGYKVQFVEGALKQGCSQQEADEIWEKLEVFSGYGFNKSHAAAYAITGYVCNWLKSNYPIQFWTAAFDFASESDIARFIGEINRGTSGVVMRPPDINESQLRFTANFDTKDLYWSLTRIKQCGESVVAAIIEEREKDGPFFDLQEAFTRLPKGKVKSNAFVNLILSGSFDRLYHITEKLSERLKLIRHYYELRKESVPERFLNRPEWWWRLQQKLISGLGHFNYRNIVKASRCKDHWGKFADATSLMSITQTERQRRIVAGVVVEVKERQSKNGKFANITIDCNSEIIPVTFWAGEWASARKDILDSKDCILIVEGRVQYDDFKYKQNIINTDKDSVFEVL